VCHTHKEEIQEVNILISLLSSLKHLLVITLSVVNKQSEGLESEMIFSSVLNLLEPTAGRETRELVWKDY
jgi:hypothetical protein